MRMLQATEGGFGMKKFIKIISATGLTFESVSLRSRTDRLAMSNFIVGSTQITPVELN